MAIPSSGAVSLSDIQTEYGGSNPISLSEYYAGGSIVAAGSVADRGAIPASGTIDIGDFRGGTSRVAIALQISGATQNYNIYANRGGTYSAGISDVVLTVQAIVGSAGTGQYAIDTGNQWASGDTVKIINNSQIVGAGGEGGDGGTPGSSTGGQNGASAGSAINLGIDTTIQNNGGFIRGGGGGGGGGAGGEGSYPDGMKGSIAKGGQGGGGGGGAGQNGGPGGANRQNAVSAQSQPGQAGSISGPGNGGAGFTDSEITGCDGGQGGAFGQAGQAGEDIVFTGVPQSTQNYGFGSGGAGGKAINLNGNAVTYEDGSSNVQGAVS